MCSFVYVYIYNKVCGLTRHVDATKPRQHVHRWCQTLFSTIYAPAALAPSRGSCSLTSGWGDGGAADVATGEAEPAKSSQDDQRQDEPILDVHSKEPGRQEEHSNDLTQSRRAKPRRFPASQANPRGREELPHPRSPSIYTQLHNES